MSDDEGGVGLGGEGLGGEADGRFGTASKARLEELIAMAQVARGWSARQLAQFLDRDPHNMVPKSGIPRVDLVYRLARALGWSPAAVLEDLCGDRARPSSAAAAPDTYASLNRAAYEAFAKGEFELMVSLALRAHGVAVTPDERAEACLREAGGWDGLGRYVEALDALQRGLQQVGIAPRLRARMCGSLANLYFILGRVVEGEGVASAALEDLGEMDDGVDPVAREESLAFSLYVRGQCRKARLLLEPALTRLLAARAAADLREARRIYAEFASRTGVRVYDSVADTCSGALLVVSGIADGTLEESLTEILARLDSATDVRAVAPGFPRENIGWWCVFGCELAARLDPMSPRRDQLLGIFLNKGYEVVELTGHWVLRERLLVFEYVRRLAESASERSVLDDDDIKQVVATMGRFPSFRPVAWDLLRTCPRV